MTFKHLSMAMEAIDYQPSDFFKQLKIAYALALTNKTHDQAVYAKVGAMLTEVTKKHLNLMVSYVFSDEPMQAIFPLIDMSSPLLPDRTGEEAEGTTNAAVQIQQSRRALKGSVDLSISRVTGVFSKAPCTVMVDTRLMERLNLSAGEMAAQTLHELGHIFSIFELMDRVASTNQVLAALDRGLRGEIAPKNKQFLIDLAGQELGFERAVVQDIAKSTNDTTVISLFMAQAYKGLRAGKPQEAYDLNTLEMMADQFAARHGAGKDLATATFKTHQYYGYAQLQNPLVYYSMELAKYAVGTLTIAGGKLVSVAEAFTDTKYGEFVAMWTANIMLADPDHESYDRPKDRLIRVRRQLIEQSRLPRRSKKQTEQLVEDVKLIDAMVAQYNENTPFVRTIGKYFTDFGRTKEKSIQLQKDLEALALNDLFLKAAELRHA